MSSIDLNIIKEQYQRMPDHELIRFAQNESLSLTLQSFHLLKAEFKARNLDFSVIESAQVDRELAEATKISELEKTIAATFTETIWKFAFTEKEAGKSNEDIYNALLKKNITPEYAYMLIESIEPRSRELADSFENEIIIGWILFVLGLFLSVFLFNQESIRGTYLLWGPVLTIAGMVRLATSYARKKKYQTIVRNIEAEKEV
ncbi:MAG: hypothetical protein IPP31_01850 [Chitinophagaceae bacterium]|nr:hypothetical protein [Chitinophagaceae bacterium]